MKELENKRKRTKELIENLPNLNYENLALEERHMWSIIQQLKNNILEGFDTNTQQMLKKPKRSNVVSHG